MEDDDDRDDSPGATSGGGVSATAATAPVSQRLDDSQVEERLEEGKEEEQLVQLLAAEEDRHARSPEYRARRAVGGAAGARDVAGVGSRPAGSLARVLQTEESGEERTSSSSSSSSGEEEDEAQSSSKLDEEAEGNALLGPPEDRAALADIVRRFEQDDLADQEDPLHAAVWMQVHQMSGFSICFYVLLTCGLWFLFRPREDFGALLLTKKGRVISYGKTQTAQPGSVGLYLMQVLASIAVSMLLACVLISLASGTPNFRLAFADKWWVVNIYLWIALPLIAITVYAHRPRRDCGSTFRQHFEVDNLSAASYARTDSGRKLQTSCQKRRRGHLRLFFGRVYPDAAAMAEGLPAGTPDVGSLTPVARLPSAAAGERTLVHREAKEAADEAFKSTGGRGLTRTTSGLLAFLGILGASYEYSAFLWDSYEGFRVCSRKIAGCQWRVDNSAWVGTKQSVQGAVPPIDYASKNCTAKGEFCQEFVRPSDYCAVDRQTGSRKSVRLACSEVRQLWDAVTLDFYKDAFGHEHVRYVLHHDKLVDSLATGEMPVGGVVMIEKSMTLTGIGRENSAETKLLKRDHRFADHELEYLLELCHQQRTHSLDLVFQFMAAEEPLFEEDCMALQESCLAESFGPTTNGWWPPSRLWDRNLESQRTLCLYRSLPASIVLGHRVWRLLEEDLSREGLTCHGTPIAEHVFHGMDKLANCKAACEAKSGCNFIFFGPLPGAANADHVHSRRAASASADEAPAPADSPNGSSVNATGLPHRCLLYSSCPSVGSSAEARPGGTTFEEVNCSISVCNGTRAPCAAFEERRFQTVNATVASAAGCRAACINVSNSMVQCNAYVVDEDEGSCTVFGPALLQVKAAGWQRLTSRREALGVLGRHSSQGSRCFARPWPLPRNRKRAGSPGILKQWSDKYLCAGCTARAVTEYYFQPTNFMQMLGNLITVLSFVYLAKKAHDHFQSGRVVFPGKPTIDMIIVQDIANPTGFDEREQGYLEFLTRCMEVSHPFELKSQLEDIRDCWDSENSGESESCDAQSVEAGDFEHYELTNTLRTECYVDRRLLGLFPGEAVLGAWTETRRHGIIFTLLFAALYGLLVMALYYAVPEDYMEFSVVKFVLYGLIPGAFLLYEYVQIHRELQAIGVVTSSGRLVQLSRRPPPPLLPVWFGGVSLRLDSFKVGRLSHAQLDMAAVPLWRDWFRSLRRQAWCRGLVTLRGEHGLLEILRTNGEAKHVFQAVGMLVDAKRTEGLRVVSPGRLELCGLHPARDLLGSGEEHIWECRLDEYGLVADPFNYASLLTITDRRILVSRLRCPKPLSLRGLLLGPLTCGLRCTALQELLGHQPYITVTCIGHNNLESYATTRTQAPPFWPGFLPPVHAVGVVFLTRYMQEYPASLTVVQKPYGLNRDVTVLHEVRLRSTEEGLLRIAYSEQPGAPCGQAVVAVRDPRGKEVSMRRSHWDSKEGVSLDLGTSLRLEAADPEWQGTADEPWLRQLRYILDFILGRARVPEEVWQEMLAAPPPPEPGCSTRLLAHFVGTDMLGHQPKIPLAPRGDDPREALTADMDSIGVDSLNE